ncbi:MAG: LysE family translocator [Hyphomicrobiales bacterium]|nr:LysE family translocator [Hyphomicrobiales bacterium]
MEITILAIFAVALCINSSSPGPSVAALVARVLTSGWRSVMPLLAAMWIGEALWLTAAVFGLSVMAQTFYWAFVILKYLGVVYLLYLAYRMWTAPSVVKDGALPAGDSSWRLFLTGMAITLGNPKIMVFYVALLPSIVDLARISLMGWMELTVTMVAVIVAVDLTWVMIAAQARRWLKSPRAVRIANRTSATAMGGAALVIATR